MPSDWRGRRDAEAARALEAELSLLRKHAGFTPSRLVKAPILLHMLGGSDQTFEVHRERFISAIRSLRDPEPELLMAIFRLTPQTADLARVDQRRALYGTTIERGTDTVANQERPALEHLRSQLITGWYPKSPLSVRVPESHNGAVFESVTIRTIVKDGLWHETQEHYRLFAAFDEADYLAISSSFPGRVIADGDFTARLKRISDSYTHQFWHKTPMRRGRFYDLRFRVVPDSDAGEAVRLTEASRAFHEPTRHANFEVSFLGERPQTIWSFDRLTYFERPGEFSAGRRLTPRRQTVSADYYELYGGLFHGIAWQW